MYTPPDYVENDRKVIDAVIRANPFGLLVSTLEGAPQASHLPFVLDGGRLIAHMARANPQWRSFDGETEVLCVFQGPHAYVSPRWYARKKAVPTWNYVAVHVHGVPRIVGDPEECLEMQRRLVSEFEARADSPWSMKLLPDSYVATMMRAVVNFEIPVARAHGKFKLNQKNTAEDRAGVVAALRAGPDERAHAIAELMAARERG